ncbi:hypothetical protein G7085_02780 [Tessaracoccus sp. HDW20]|uniref:hypothetical protein n=1 Tax=Tessaracoccus coleopterorum TaxID=2714950 RepID=UPI0018D2D920|nr:hypothetical protein [Tessaracoccus coleopterorum]NHB83949.1 hypothetical protein [Tessaracoccus coleopterorum]
MSGTTMNDQYAAALRAELAQTVTRPQPAQRKAPGGSRWPPSSQAPSREGRC